MTTEIDPELDRLLEAEADPWAFCSTARRPYYGRGQIRSPLKLRIGRQVIVHLRMESVDRDHLVTIADINGDHICFREWRDWTGSPAWYHLGDLGVVRMPCNGLWHRWHFMKLAPQAAKRPARRKDAS